MRKINNRLFLLFLFYSLFPLFLIFKLFNIQVFKHNFFFEKSRKQVSFIRTEFSARGRIYDVNNNLLAITFPIDCLEVDINKSKNIDKLIFNLSSLLNIPQKELKKNLPIIFEGVLEETKLTEIRKNKKNKFQHLIYKRKWIREHPEGNLASYTLGFTGDDGVGRSGIELKYNEYLKGNVCSRKYFRDGKNEELTDDFFFKEMSDGCDVVLTIDKKIQYIVENELESAYKLYNPKRITGIVQRPSTGEILSIATIPNFNFNTKIKVYDELRNPAVEDVFEPGSIIKPFIMLAALEEKLFKETDIINCEDGEYKIYTTTIKDHQPHKNLTLSGIIAYSSNIGMSKIAAKIGYEKIYYCLKKFGFGNPTNIDLPGEASGILKEPQSPDIQPLTPLMVSFGYNLSVTPIQLITAYSAIANGGFLYQPFIVKEIVSPEGETLINFKPNLIRQILTKNSINIMKKMLTNVVIYGTGKKAEIDGCLLAGKTGTAEKLDPDTKKYTNHLHISSFCGFFPVDNPIYTILVVIDEPSTTYWASETAAPLFSNIAKRLLFSINENSKRIN